MGNFWVWLAYVGVAYMVYTILPDRVRVVYLLVVLAGGILFAESSGSLGRISDTLKQLGGS